MRDTRSPRRRVLHQAEAAVRRGGTHDAERVLDNGVVDDHAKRRETIGKGYASNVDDVALRRWPRSFVEASCRER